MKRNWKIILLTGIVLLAVIVLAVNLYESGKKEVLTQFREQQFVYAHHLAVHIDSFFLYHSWRLQELAASIVRHDHDIGKIKAHIQDHLGSFRQQMEKAHVKEILLQDEIGSIINDTDGKISGLIEGQSEHFAWAVKEENRGELFVSALSQAQPLHFLVSTPLYQQAERHPKEIEKFVGVLSLVVDLKELLSDELGAQEPKNMRRRRCGSRRDSFAISPPNSSQLRKRKGAESPGSCTMN